uniref:Beta-carotene hydroxylase n=1 Tax=Nephroselmis astigmatica TaxID=259378 RepID=A0A088CKF5_9CHLO|nr:beta-carotene hydroxylase [Nephroselmis astigmatica]AID67744.1 beta-carotene hydroxylase [Nephroselmis astigmatica]
MIVFAIFGYVVFGWLLGFYSVASSWPHLLEHGNPTGIRCVFGGFGALLGFPCGIFWQEFYRRLKINCLAYSTEQVISQLSWLITTWIITNLFSMLCLCLPFPWLFKITLLVLGNFTHGFVWWMRKGKLKNRQSTYWLNEFAPDFAQTIEIIRRILTPARKRLLDVRSITHNQLLMMNQTGFLEGPWIIPQDVIDGLHRLASSENSNLRYRGKRGLVILNLAKQAYPNKWIIDSNLYTKYPNYSERFIAASKFWDATILVSRPLKDVPAISIQEIFQSLRSPYYPGDILDLRIRRSGKYPRQAIGWLEDGTIVIVEKINPKFRQNSRIRITHVLQSVTGTMIFAEQETRETI